MFKLVIAEDEKYVIQLIRRLIDFNSFDIEIVGEATDGLSALELVKALQPDILITDIRMPGLDGIELIDSVRASGIPVSIIIVSGHKQFDYAYNAIKNGVDDFIIKPISRDNLNSSLAKVCARLHDKKNSSIQIEKMEQQLNVSKSKLRSQLIEECLSDKPVVESISNINKNYMFCFAEGDYTGIAIKVDIPGIDGDYSIIMEHCRKVIIKVMHDFCIDMEYIACGSRIYGLMNTTGNNTRRFEQKIKKLFETLSLELDIYSGSTLSIGLGPSVHDIGEISQTVSAAKACVRCKCILGSGRIYYADKLDMYNIDKQLSGTQVEMLRSMMELGTTDGIKDWLDIVFSRPVSYYTKNPIEAVALADAVTNNFFSTCDILAIRLEYEKRQKFLDELDNVQGFEQMLSLLKTFITDVMEADRQMRLQRNSYPVNCAKEYIAAHLGEQIKLEDIAKSVLLSPSYLSALFKNETGENISDYMQRLRLEEAKRLLKTTNLNVNEIASRVGYTDPKHFSKMFKKQTGSRPLEYRKLYSW